MALGRRLQMARKFADMTIETLAKETGIPEIQIQRMEVNDIYSTPHLYAFARALKVNDEWLETGAMVRPFGASRTFFEECN